MLKIENISKQFAPIGSNKPIQALDDVSFHLEKGLVCGLLGPNGAGKTTLLRIISSILKADSGRALIDGHEPGSDHARSIIGYMPEERGLYPNMRVLDQINYFAQLHGADPRSIAPKVGEYLELFNLSDDRFRRISTLSKGNQQKIQIIATIAHSPQLVILDEPFSGFDPLNADILSRLIDHLRSQGVTIILSSHNMPAIQEACDSILLIDKGRLLIDGRVDEVRRSYADGSYLLRTTEPLDEKGLAEVCREITLTNADTHEYRVQLLPGRQGQGALLGRVSEMAEIERFELLQPSLAQIFMQVSRRD